MTKNGDRREEEHERARSAGNGVQKGGMTGKWEREEKKKKKNHWYLGIITPKEGLGLECIAAGGKE